MSISIDARLDTRHVVREFLNAGLFVDPPLAGIEREQYTGEASALILTAAEDLCHRHADPAQLQRDFEGVPCTERTQFSAVQEILASTAILLAHSESGRLRVDLRIVKTSVRLVSEYLQRQGFSSLYWAYAMITTYFNLHVIRYYGVVDRREFVSGTLHRPWVADTLEDDLSYLLAFNLVVPVQLAGRVCVSLSSLGVDVMKELERALRDTGYLSKRAQLLAISHFDSLHNMDELQFEAWPNALDERRQFLTVAGIRPGMNVLEVGVGTGLLTVEAGLAQSLTPGGIVTGIDISAGMLRRAESKVRSQSIDNVRFTQADVQRLPFANDQFDAALGYEFIHFTNYEKTIAELQRVTRTGGVVATAGPVIFDWSVPFFKEWFEPLLELASRRETSEQMHYMPRPFEVENAFRRQGFQYVRCLFTHSEWVFGEPKKVIEYMIQGVSFFREELLDLPWKAKEQLIYELHRRGMKVCQEYSPEERRVHLPGEFVIGVV